VHAHLRLPRPSSAPSPFNFRFLACGLSDREQSTPLTEQETQLSSSSLMTHLTRRNWQASQGGWLLPRAGESESGELNPLVPLKASRLMLPWRLGGNRDGLGAMGMGAVRAMALGLDMMQE
jgi:hypothetical protein